MDTAFRIPEIGAIAGDVILYRQDDPETIRIVRSLPRSQAPGWLLDWLRPLPELRVLSAADADHRQRRTDVRKRKGGGS